MVRIRKKSRRGEQRPSRNLRWPAAVLAAIDALYDVGGLDRTLFVNAAAAYLLDNPGLRDEAFSALARWENSPPLSASEDASDWARQFCAGMFSSTGQRPAAAIPRRTARKAGK